MANSIACHTMSCPHGILWSLYPQLLPVYFHFLFHSYAEPTVVLVLHQVFWLHSLGKLYHLPIPCFKAQFRCHLLQTRLSLTVLSSPMLITMSDTYQRLHNHLLNAIMLPSSTSLHLKSRIFETERPYRITEKNQNFHIPDTEIWKNDLFKITWLTVGRVKTKILVLWALKVL